MNIAVPQTFLNNSFCRRHSWISIINSVESIIQSVNTELPAIQNWLLRNKLSLNVNKSHAIIYSTSHVNRQVYSIVLCDESDLIPISNNVKYLGVFIDSILTLKYNIDQIVARVAKIVGIFHRIGGQVPYHVMLNLYYSLVYPHLQYCNLIWGCAPNSYMNKILLLQKKSYVQSLRAMMISHRWIICTNEWVICTDELLF